MGVNFQTAYKLCVNVAGGTLTSSEDLHLILPGFLHALTKEFSLNHFIATYPDMFGIQEF